MVFRCHMLEAPIGRQRRVRGELKPPLGKYSAPLRAMPVHIIQHICRSYLCLHTNIFTQICKGSKWIYTHTADSDKCADAYTGRRSSTEVRCRWLYIYIYISTCVCMYIYVYQYVYIYIYIYRKRERERERERARDRETE